MEKELKGTGKDKGKKIIESKSKTRPKTEQEKEKEKGKGKGAERDDALNFLSASFDALKALKTPGNAYPCILAYTHYAFLFSVSTCIRPCL